MLKLNTEIIRNSHVIARKIKKEFIVVDANIGRLYRLNPTAEVIWKYTSVPRSVKEITEKIASNFSVDKKRARKEIVQFINQHLNTLFFLLKNELFHNKITTANISL